MNFNTTVIAMFVIYLAIMMAIGLIFYFRTKSLSDYVLGGRSLNGWVASLSAQASDMSGWLLMGLPGYAYLAGLEAIWIALGLAIGTYFNWKIVAKRLRVYTEVAGDSLTLPDFFQNRFKDGSNILRIISAILILVFFSIYTASGFVAGGTLFSTVFDISYINALIIGVLVIVSYTFLGGFMAVCWTDFFQGAMMFLAVLVVPIIGFFKLGGVGETFSAISNFNPELMNPFTSVDGSAMSFIAIISLAAWGLGYFGQPHILVRFMAIKSKEEIKKARWVAMVWVAISLAAAVIIGMVGVPYLTQTLVLNESETVFMLLVSDMFPPVIAGFLLAAVLAAVMSTADSQLLVTASSITEDFYKVLIKKDASEKELVWVSRIAVVVVATIAFIIAYNPNSSILGMVGYAWAGFGATFGPAIILSLFWDRMTRNGALAGFISGAITVIVWKNLSGGIFDLYEIVPGFIVSMLFIVVFTLIDKEPSEEIKKEFAKVNEEVSRI
ncbi:sodium/proline symporter PutP [Clostridium sp. DL1XJH146]